MSSSIQLYIGVLVATLMHGDGLQPYTLPRPVVNTPTLQPPLTRPVMLTGSLPGVSMKHKPLASIGSA